MAASRATTRRGSGSLTSNWEGLAMVWIAHAIALIGAIRSQRCLLMSSSIIDRMKMNQMW